MRSGLDTDFFSLPLPRTMAHRGASGYYPENTLIAFEAARRMGASYLELDIHMTRDGEIVVAHDEDLGRTTGHDGLIREMTFVEVARADAGYSFSPDGNSHPFRASGVRIPTLAEVFAALSDRMFVVEIKQTAPSLVEAMIQVMEKAGMLRRVLVASEHQAPLSEFRRLRPEIPTNFSADEVRELIRIAVSGSKLSSVNGDALQIPPEYESMRLVTAGTVAAAHALGVEMHVWTVNEENEMRQMVDLGVDGIITDYPDRMLAVAKSA